MIAALLFATAVFVLTVTLWPEVEATALPRFIEDDEAPRTLH